MSRKVLAGAAIAVAASVLLGAGYLAASVAGFIEFDGTGYWPRFGFRQRSAAYDRLEADRIRQRQGLPPPSARDARAVLSPPMGPAVDDVEPDAAPEPDVAGETEPAPAAEVIIPFPGPHADAVVPPDAVESAPVRPARWTDFRGGARNGRYEAPIDTDWSDVGPPLLWKQPIGGGYASFVIVDGRAWTIEQRRNQEVVVAYDVETGRELWTHGWDGLFRESMGGDGPRATPTWYDGRVYALGAEGELRCLDADTGRLLWRRQILEENGTSNLTWAMSAAPLVVDDKVIVLPGGSPGRSVVAYDRLTGERLWSTLDDRQAYTSPMFVTLAGQSQLLVVSAERAMGLEVEDGTLLWDYPWRVASVPNIAQPVLLGEDRVFLSAGYGHGAAVFQVVRNGDRFETQTAWRNLRMKNKFSSSVLHGGYLYGLDEAILACVDADTGEQMWKGGRYGYGQLVLAGNHLVITTEGGDLVLVEATPERHREVARVPALRGKTWNHPAIADGRLLVRNTTEMAAFDVRPDP